MIVSAFCANMIVVSHTTTLSVLGAGMALRGPDGSMVTASDGLYEERRSVFFTFGIGLACTVGSAVTCVWLFLHLEAAIICMGITSYSALKMFYNYRRVSRHFCFDESETVSFDDIFNGPAAIQVVKSGLRMMVQNTLTMSPRSRRKHYAEDGDDEDDDGSGPLMPSMNGGNTKRRPVKHAHSDSVV